MWGFKVLKEENLYKESEKQDIYGVFFDKKYNIKLSWKKKLRNVFLRKTGKKTPVNMFVKCCKITSHASGRGH